MGYLRQFGPARTFVTLEPYTRQGYVAHCVDCARPEDKIEGYTGGSLTLKSSLYLEPCVAAAKEHARTVHPGKRTYKVGDRVTRGGPDGGPYGTVVRVADELVLVRWGRPGTPTRPTDWVSGEELR